MINSAALLPSLSRSSGLSPRSAIGLNIIRRDSIAVDSLLKERLVLSKIRYGIERQEQERERRRNREADLEADSKQNYEVGDAPNNPRKRRRGIGGLLGTVFGGILSSLGGVAFQAAPAFLLARSNVLKGGVNFNRTIGATGGLLNTIKGQRGQFDTLKKVKLDPVKNIGKTITRFGNSLTFFVNSAIAGQVGGRALSKLRTPAQVKAQVAQSAKVRQKITSKVVARERVLVKEVAKVRAKKQSVAVKQGVKNPVRKKSTPAKQRVPVTIGGSIAENQEEFLNQFTDPATRDRLRKTLSPSFGGSSTRRKMTMDDFLDPNIDPFDDFIDDSAAAKARRRPFGVKGGQVGPPLGGIEASVPFDADFMKTSGASDPLFLSRGIDKTQRLSLIAGLKRTLGLSIPYRVKQDLLKISDIEFIRFYRDNTGFDISEGFGPPQAPFRDRPEKYPRTKIDFGVEGGRIGPQPPDVFKSVRMGPNIEQFGPFEVRETRTPAARAKRFQQTFGTPTGANPFTGQGTFGLPSITSFDPKTGVTTQKLTGGREFDPITGGIKAKKRSVKASKVAPKKGIGKFLANIGGSQFLKPVKEFVGKGVKNIPFIGDLIGILLDVFVFGEPIQRALFLAGGSALGGFLGGLAGSIGGPPGILIGGIIGGIAGDLLGGAFYDLLFRRGQRGSAGQRFGASATKASIKAGLFTGGFAGYGTYMLGEGGREFVLDADSTAALERRSPGFLMALNKARGAQAIGVIEDYASYDKTSTGKERMIPIPIPTPQNDSSSQNVITTDSEVEGGTGGGFITFLSDHYRRA